MMMIMMMITVVVIIMVMTIIITTVIIIIIISVIMLLTIMTMTQKGAFKIMTTPLLRRELSSARTLTYPRRNRLQTTGNSFGPC